MQSNDELVRVGSTFRGKLVYSATRSPTQEAEFEAERFNPLVRATVRFVRSRPKELPPQEKARLRELARKEAVLSGFVADAIEHWPR